MPDPKPMPGNHWCKRVYCNRLPKTFGASGSSGGAGLVQFETVFDAIHPAVDVVYALVQDRIVGMDAGHIPAQSSDAVFE